MSTLRTNKFRDKLKKFTAIALAGIIALTSINITTPLTAHAEDTGGQDTGGNSGGGDNGVGDYADLDFTGPPAWKLQQQGYRLYVVKDSQRISDIYDYTFSTPTGVGEALFDTRFDGPNSPSSNVSSGHVHRTSISDFKIQCHGVDNIDVPAPIIKEGNYKGNGQAFKEWLMGEGDPTQAGNILHTGTNNSGHSSSGNSGSNSGNSSSSGGNGGGGESQDEYKRDQDAITEGKAIYNSSVNKNQLIDYYREKDNNNTVVGPAPINKPDSFYEVMIDKDVSQGIQKYMSSYTGYVKAYHTAYKDMNGKECKYAALTKIRKKMGQIGTGIEASMQTLILKGLFDTYTLSEDLINSESESSWSSKTSNNITTDSNTSVALSITSDNLLLQELIPLSQPTAEGGKFPLFWYGQLENSPKGFYMPDYVDKYETLGDALYDGCWLIVEPISWINLRTNASNKTARDWAAASSYKSQKTYGSYYNICKDWKSTGGTYSPIMDWTFPNCMATSKDVVSDTGFKVVAPSDYTSKKIPSEGKDLVYRGVPNGAERYGLAMHLYSGLGGTDSTTSTYDEPKGNTPSPSEDCSTFPEETEYGVKSKKANIIKAYVTIKADGTEQNDGFYIRQNVCHTVEIEDEPEYTVIDYQTSQETNLPYGLTESNNGQTTYNYEQLTQGSTKTQHGTSSGQLVTLTEQENILYVKLVKQEVTTPITPHATGDYILHESEITRAVSTDGTGIDSRSIPINISYTFPDITFSDSASCGRHTNQKYDNFGNEIDYDKCSGVSSNTGSVADSNVELAAINANEASNPNIIAQSSNNNFKSSMTTVSLNRGSNAGQFNADGNHIYYFTLNRHENGEENLSLSGYNQKQSSNADVAVGTTQTINANNKNIVTTLGYTATNTKTSKTRAAADYNSSITFKFVYSPSTSPDISTSWTLDHKSCSHGASVGGTEAKDITTATEVSDSSTVAVQVYSGSANKTLNTKVTAPKTGANGEKYLPENIPGMGYKPSTATSTTNVGNKTVGIMSSTGTTIKFNPFIRMTFSKATDLASGNAIKYPVNVISEYQRELQPNDYAEVEWNYGGDNEYLIELKSQMWATDQSLTNGADSWRKPNSVLKGGSSYQLSIPDSKMRSITLRTYQSVVPDSYTFVTNKDNLSASKAAQAHNDFITDVTDTFEQLHVVQRITKNIETTKTLADENKVERGGNISFLNNNSNGTASTDSKYYLSKDGANGLNSSASEGDLDIKNVGTNTKYYKIWSDVFGNILIADGTDLNALADNINGTIILTKNQTVADLTNQTAIALNARTLAVEKLLDSIERNTGDDKTAEWASSDGKWYNESFATYIAVQSTELKLGFKNTATRGAVIDPKLIPYLSSKSQQGKSQAFTSQFTTDNYSNKYSPSESGKVGNFKGKSVYMKDMNKLLQSKLFYIPNMTVQGSR